MSGPSLPREWVEAHHRHMTGAQMAECLAEYRRGYAEGVASARTEIRARARAILALEEAQGRRALAQHMAFETDLSTEQVRTVLQASPKEAAPRRGLLDAAIRANGGSPDVGPEFAFEDQSAAHTAKRIAGSAP